MTRDGIWTLGTFFSKACFVVFLLLASLSAMHAQETATILGAVKDPSGGAVAGATVTARNIGTGEVRTTVTESDGNYRIPALFVGNYEVRAEHQGFTTGVRSGVELTVALQAVINFTLEIGSVQQTVQVTGEAPLVNTTTSSLGGLVNDERMADLPLNGRNYINLALMQPGMVDQQNGGHNEGYTGNFVIGNGTTARSNSYLLDGAEMVNMWGVSSASVSGATLGVDGIKEFRVITNAMPAQYGMVMGSEMVMVSQSGTNALHGDVFDYLRNSAMDAKNYFDTPQSSGGRRLPPFRRNDFGASLGGPIKKNKIFFDVVYEGLRAVTGYTETSKVVPASCLLLPGTAKLVNPAKCAADVGASAATFPTSEVSPALVPFLNLDAMYPANLGPALPGGDLANFTYGFNQPTREDFGQARVDETLSSKDTLFERWTIDDGTQPIVGTFPGWYTSGASRNQFITVSENHVFSTALLNTVSTSFSRTNTVWGGVAPSIAMAPNLECQVPIEPYMGTCGSGISGLSGPVLAAPRVQKMNVWTQSDDLFYTRGKHSLQFGELFHAYQEQPTNGAGQSLTTQVFSSMANFLNAVPVDVALNTGPGYYRHWRYNTFGLYAQDDYRVTSRLTLNLGLRYEFMTTPYEDNGQNSVITNVATSPGYTITPYVYYKNPSYRNFSPRLGFAWDLRGDGKTAIRGGFGKLFDLNTLDVILLQTQVSTPPFAERLENTPGLGLPTGAAYTLPFNSVFPPGAATALTLAGTPTATLISPRPLEWSQSYAYTYNLAIERQLPGNMSLTVAYAGSKGYHLAEQQEGNPVIPQGVPGPNGTCVVPPAGHVPNLTSMMDNGSATACWLTTDATSANPTNGVVVPGLTGARTNPNFGSMDYFEDGGKSLYNSLQVSILERSYHGLTFQSNYTWSSNWDTQAGASGGGNENGASETSDCDDALHLYGPNCWGQTTFATPNTWVLNALYNVPSPVGDGGNRFLKGILGGWRLGTITTVQSGFPFSVTLNTERSESGVQAFASKVDRPDYAPGRSIYSITHGVSTGCTGVAAGTPLGTPTLYYDPCAFTIPNEGFLGTVPRNSLRGPNLRNIDFSLTKDTPVKWLGEGGMVEFRAEIFNILNRPNFALPSINVYSPPTTNQESTPNNGALETGLLSPFSAAGQILPENGNLATVGTSRQIQLALKILF